MFLSTLATSNVIKFSKVKIYANKKDELTVSRIIFQLFEIDCAFMLQNGEQKKIKNQKINHQPQEIHNKANDRHILVKIDYWNLR